MINSDLLSPARRRGWVRGPVTHGALDINVI